MILDAAKLSFVTYRLLFVHTMFYWASVIIEKPSPSSIDKAIAILQSGEVFGMPTETVYGLGADATDANAIAKIYALKNRPQFNPLISHVIGLEMASDYGLFDETAKMLANKFWPGPLTIIVKRLNDCGVCDLACAGLETIALRAPNHSIALEIIEKFGKPIAAPSANISGHISPISASHVFEEFADSLKLIIDGGECQIGLESTVISAIENNITILRHGAISAEDIEKITGTKPQIANLFDEKSPKSPGMSLRHYSPNAPLFMNCEVKGPGEILIGFGEVKGDYNLSKSGDLTEAAANLYKMLRIADAQKPKAIKIAPIPEIAIGIAINDRLSRAVAKST